MTSISEKTIRSIATRLAQTLVNAKSRRASTRSVIGVLLSGGSVRWIYCHSDSYNNLSMLRQYYKDPSDVADLINGGDIRNLEDNVEDVERYGAPPRFFNSVESFLSEGRNYDYCFLYRGGKWNEVSAGVPSRQVKPDMKYVHIVEAGEALRKALHVGLARPEFEQTMTMQEENHNKYHYFAIYNADGEYVGGNAYGGIGQNPRTVEIARGGKNTVYNAVSGKINEKRRRGYNVEGR